MSKNKDLSNYFVLKIKRENDEWEYLGSIYANSCTDYRSIDDAMKFPDKDTPKQLGEYICWREEEYISYKVIEVKTIMEEVE